MNRDQLRAMLDQVAAGAIAPGEAMHRLSWNPVEELGADAFARIDHHRALRQGFPEVVFGPGKTVAQLLDICAALAARGAGFLVTRADDAARDALRQAYPLAIVSDIGRVAHLPAAEDNRVAEAGTILVVSAGTGDIPVAEEAALSARAFGNPVETLYDVGVAGIHRLLARGDALGAASIVIVVAGMEGALASVVGGLVATPVIAVPTSVGYGASFDGLAALLAMLNTCAAGVTVVNIDNGFGAAAAATRINRMLSEAHRNRVLDVAPVVPV